MSQSMQDLEQDIEESRARLDATIDEIQSRLSLSGMMDEVMGTARGVPQIDTAFDAALGIVRKNPLPVLLIAAGVGWLLHRMANEPRRRAIVVREAAEAVPVLNTGAARVYDPDHSPRHPYQDVLESRRETDARL